MFFARILGSIIDRAVFKNNSGHGMGYFMIVMVLQVVLGIFASMIVMWFSRWREFRADASGAHLASRGAMISALQRLQEETQAHVPNQMPDTLTAFGISSGWKEHASRLFMTHPLSASALKHCAGVADVRKTALPCGRATESRQQGTEYHR